MVHPQPARAVWRAPKRVFRVFQRRQLDKMPWLQRLPAPLRFEMQVVASVLPFRVNEYVANDLIDWSRTIPFSA